MEFAEQLKVFKNIAQAVNQIIEQSKLPQFLQEDMERIKATKDLNFDDYKDYYSNKIQNAIELGKYGWVISPNCSVGGEAQLVKQLKKGKTEKSCLKYFFLNKSCVQTVIDELRDKYQTSYLKLYFDGFERNYKRRDYMSAIFFIVSILETRMKGTFKDANISTRYKKIANDGIDNKQQKYFNQAQANGNYHTSVFVINEFLPSFQEFAKRTFIEEDPYIIGGTEPPYFNRNWLMHGKRTRPVEKYEVLQVLNALSSLEAIKDALDKYSC